MTDHPVSNRVWIELEKPTSKEHADEQCRLANRMISRLAKPGDMPKEEGFFYSEIEKRYCYGGHHGYVVCVDNGHWFNLDYFGREE